MAHSSESILPYPHRILASRDIVWHKPAALSNKEAALGTERFNRQFILLDFEDLDNPDFMEVVRSPEFSTYLVMRRYIWRSTEREHSLGLHEYYAQGALACALSREKIAECLGGVSVRQVSRDIKALIERNLIKPVRTGRGSIFILGRWANDQDDNVYYEYYFLDRLQTRPDKNVISDMTSKDSPSDDPIGQERQVRPDNYDQADLTDTADINREVNRESNREKGEISNSKSPSSLPSNSSSQSSFIRTVVKTCSREFRDMGHLASNITRAHNIWARTDLTEDEFVDRVQEARLITKQRISVSAINDRSKKMPYFFAVLEDVLGLKAPG